jgi:hypothetical protein
LGTFLLALLSLSLGFTQLGCATSKPADPCRSARLTREEAAKLGGVDPNAAGVEIRCTTQDQLVQMYDPLGNLNRSVVWLVQWGAEFAVTDDASGLTIGRGGSGRGQRGVPSEPMLPQP